MKSQNNGSNFPDWNLSLPKTHNRVITFEAQQKAKETEREPASIGTITKATDVKNPYLRARIEVLTKYPEWKRNEIKEMERTMNINNLHYDAFVHEVAVLGDTYMPLC